MFFFCFKNTFDNFINVSCMEANMCSSFLCKKFAISFSFIKFKRDL